MNTQQVKWEWSIEDPIMTSTPVCEEPADSFEDAKAKIEAYILARGNLPRMRGVIGRETLVQREDGEFGWDYDSFRVGGDGQWRLWE